MKKLLAFVAALLLCVAIMCPALAEYGYTRVSDIPMAVDFTFSVGFNGLGLPYVVTDYPYKATGATEMTLIYRKSEYETIPLEYNFARNETFVGHTYYEGHNTIPTDQDKVQEFKNGTLTLDDSIYIYTTNNNEKVDWILEYSISKKTYVRYMERTFSQGYNAMGAGGFEKRIYYNNKGILKSSFINKRMDNGDLTIYYNANGDITEAYVHQYKGEYSGRFHEYNKSTGLFNGIKLSEFGFSDDDINTPAPAALGSKRDPSANQKIEAYVTRCYQIILGRDPDEGGL